MKKIREISEAISGNLDEARRYIMIAYRQRDTDPDLAAWYRDMANSHLTFNHTGHAIAADAIKEAKEDGQKDEMIPGMMAVYNQRHGEMISEQAEIAAMIAAYR